MMYERLRLMRDLLADDGSIYVHCDWRVNGALRIVMDEIFGSRNFVNQIDIWKRTTAHGDAIARRGHYDMVHDSILFYCMDSDLYVWNTQYIPFSDEQIKQQYNKLGKLPARTAWLLRRRRSQAEILPTNGMEYARRKVDIGPTVGRRCKRCTIKVACITAALANHISSTTWTNVQEYAAQSMWIDINASRRRHWSVSTMPLRSPKPSSNASSKPPPTKAISSPTSSAAPGRRWPSRRSWGGSGSAATWGDSRSTPSRKRLIGVQRQLQGGGEAVSRVRDPQPRQIRAAVFRRHRPDAAGGRADRAGGPARRSSTSR